MRNKKEKLPSALAGEKGSYIHFKKRAQFSNKLRHNILQSAPDWAKELETNLLRDLKDCNKWLKIRHTPRYKDLPPETKIIENAFHCRRDKLCSFCAIQKSQKVFHQIRDKIEFLGLKADDLILLTISPKNEKDLRTGIDVNRNFVKTLFQGNKNAKRRKNARIETHPWFAVDGWIGKLETTYNENGTWHPHYHFLVAPKATHKHLFETKHIPHSYGSGNSHYESTFAKYVGDLMYRHTGGESYIVHTRPVEDMGKGIAEVSKYLFKFSAMPAKKTWEVMLTTKRMRLASTGGIFRGIKLEPDEMDDTIDLNDNSRPWIDVMLSWDGEALKEALRGSNDLDKLSPEIREQLLTDDEKIDNLKKEGYTHFLRVYDVASKATKIVGSKFEDGSIDYEQMIENFKECVPQYRNIERAVPNEPVR